MATEVTQTSGRKKGLIKVGTVILIGLILGGGSALVVLLIQNGDASKSAPYPLILISADGMRPDYLTFDGTNNITQFGKSGVRAKYLLSQFPSKSFPNHYSIVTGLYVESHGIIFDKFYDYSLEKQFDKKINTSKNDPSFWLGEPIWITAKKNGLKSASFYWTGSEAEGKQPTYFREYNESTPFSDRVTQVLEWLKLPEEQRPSIITLYFHQPDADAHKTGAASEAVRKHVHEIDGCIGQLMHGLQEMNMSDSVNVIFLSDHGMTNTHCKNIKFMDEYEVKPSSVEKSVSGAVLAFRTKNPDDREEVFNKIKCVDETFHSFYKEDLPKRMHFSNSKRIDDIIVLAELGRLVAIDSKEFVETCSLGTHGYDPIIPDMWTVFMARGPSFLKNKVVDHFSNVEVYNLLSALLKIKPAPNNGTLGSLNKLLLPNAKSTPSTSQSDGTVFRQDICQFPKNYSFENKSSQKFQLDVDMLKKVFDATSQQGKLFEIKHLPWGMPEGGVGQKSCLLSQKHFIIAYSTILRIPLWAAYTINFKQILSRNNLQENCHRSDARLQKLFGNCFIYKNGYKFGKGRLIPKRDLTFDNIAIFLSSTLSNLVPMDLDLIEIWQELESIIKKWADKYSLVHVIAGSIFDADDNGLKDQEIISDRRLGNSTKNPAIPTHFYKIVTRCDENMTSDNATNECRGTIHVISFIFKNRYEKCKFQTSKKIILQNVAPVRDIELLTGINFFSKLPAQLQVDLKTFVPVELWKL